MVKSKPIKTSGGFPTQPDAAGYKKTQTQTPQVAPLSVQHTQSQARVIQNGNIDNAWGLSDKQKTQMKSKMQYDDIPKQNIQSYKNGGKVKKTGLALVHKGEVVIPKSMVKNKKAMLSSDGVYMGK